MLIYIRHRIDKFLWYSGISQIRALTHTICSSFLDPWLRIQKSPIFEVLRSYRNNTIVHGFLNSLTRTRTVFIIDIEILLPKKDRAVIETQIQTLRIRLSGENTHPASSNVNLPLTPHFTTGRCSNGRYWMHRLTHDQFYFATIRWSTVLDIIKFHLSLWIF